MCVYNFKVTINKIKLLKTLLLTKQCNKNVKMYILSLYIHIIINVEYKFIQFN